MKIIRKTQAVVPLVYLVSGGPMTCSSSEFASFEWPEAFVQILFDRDGLNLYKRLTDCSRVWLAQTVQNLGG